MLLQLRDYIKHSKSVSIKQISREFKSDSYALEPILDIWIKKGVIEKEVGALSCGSSCSGCNVSLPVYYSWVEN